MIGPLTQVLRSPAFASWSLAFDPPLVRCPILVIHGDMGGYISVRFSEFICQNSSGHAELYILEGRGHVPHREQMER